MDFFIGLGLVLARAFLKDKPPQDPDGFTPEEDAAVKKMTTAEAWRYLEERKKRRASPPPQPSPHVPAPR